MSRPWYGPFQVIGVEETGVTAERIYCNSMKDQIRVHLQRVTRCLPAFPAGCYWYGDRCQGPGHPPKWIDDFVKYDAVSMDSMEDHNEDHRGDQPGEGEHYDQLEDHRRDRPGEEEHHDQLEVHSEGQTNEEQNDQLDMENQHVKEEQFDQRQDKI